MRNLDLRTMWGTGRAVSVSLLAGFVLASLTCSETFAQSNSNIDKKIESLQELTTPETLVRSFLDAMNQANIDDARSLFITREELKEAFGGEVFDEFREGLDGFRAEFTISLWALERVLQNAQFVRMDMESSRGPIALHEKMGRDKVAEDAMVLGRVRAIVEVEGKERSLKFNELIKIGGNWRFMGRVELLGLPVQQVAKPAPPFGEATVDEEDRFLAELLKMKEATGRDNAMIYYQQAALLGLPIAGAYAGDDRGPALKETLKNGWSSESMPLLQVFETYQPAFELIRKGVAVDNAIMPEPKLDVGDTPAPTFFFAHIAAQLLCARSLYFESQGRYAPAMDDCLTVLLMGRDYGSQNAVLIAGLHASVIDRDFPFSIVIH